MKSIKILFILVVGFLFSFGLLGFFVQTRNIDGRPWAASPNLADGFSVFTDQATKWANDHFFGRWFFFKQYNSIKNVLTFLLKMDLKAKMIGHLCQKARFTTTLEMNIQNQQ